MAHRIQVQQQQQQQQKLISFVLFVSSFQEKMHLEDLKRNGRKNNLPSAGECRKERQELGSAHRFVMMNHVAVAVVVVVGNVRSVFVLIVV